MGISQVVEEASSQSLLPSDLPLPERVKQWIALFFAFEKPEIKDSEEVLKQNMSIKFNFLIPNTYILRFLMHIQ